MISALGPETLRNFMQHATLCNMQLSSPRLSYEDLNRT
jgi:hypothetical protein